MLSELFPRRELRGFEGPRVGSWEREPHTYLLLLHGHQYFLEPLWPFSACGANAVPTEGTAARPAADLALRAPSLRCHLLARARRLLNAHLSFVLTAQHEPHVQMGVPASWAHVLR